MFVEVLLPDGYTAVVCDSAGHNGFGSFDNTLVLWGGGDPGASYAETNRRQRDRDGERERER